jgi:hypothetical protein
MQLNGRPGGYVCGPTAGARSRLRPRWHARHTPRASKAGSRFRGDEEETAMQSDLVRGSALALALVSGIGLALAQQSPPPADAQQQKAQPTPSGQAGKQEPSSQTAGEKPPQAGVFVNGALAVPEAPANTDTVPAKFSAKNDADDKLSALAYTFKTLNSEQRRAIYEALKDQPAGAAFNADVGVELPSTVELHPVPDEVVRRVPQTKDYRYAVADNRVLLVSPPNRVVVGVFHADAGLGLGEGRR